MTPIFREKFREIDARGESIETGGKAREGEKKEETIGKSKKVLTESLERLRCITRIYISPVALGTRLCLFRNFESR